MSTPTANHSLSELPTAAVERLDAETLGLTLPPRPDADVRSTQEIELQGLDRRLAAWGRWAGLVCGGAAVFGLFRLLFLDLREGLIGQLYREHAGAVLGVPLSALASLALVVLLQSTAGPPRIKLSGGTELEGGAVSAALWIATFLSMALALKLLW